MDKKTELKLMQTIYDRLLDIITYNPGGNQKTPFDRQTTFVQLATPGQAVNPKDFINMMSPTKPDGDLLQSENFARMVDAAPLVQATYAKSSTTVDSVYGRVVTMANSTSEPNEEALRKYKQAQGFLYEEQTVKDFTGKETTQLVETNIYRNYKRNHAAYLKALGAYRSALNNYDLKDPKQQREWQANAPALELAVDNAWNDWRAQGASQVEDALAAMDHTINDVTKLVLEQDQKLYENSKLSAQLPGSGPWHLSYGLPTDWVDPEATDFAQFKLSTSDLQTSADSSFTKYGGETAFSSGLWNASASFEHSESASSSHVQASDVTISLELAVVNIVRPWFDGMVFSMQDWNLGHAYPPGSISSGHLLSTTTLKPLMPLIPTAFIVARNIAISGDWGKVDQSHIESATSAGGSVGYGPFKLSGRYETGSSHDRFSSHYEDGTIRVPGLQIIAWVSEIVPFSPPEPIREPKGPVPLMYAERREQLVFL